MSSLKLISATDTQYSGIVLNKMNEQRNIGLFCDVTIIIQDKKFRAHKTVLSASSTYFHQLFSVAGQVIELNFIRAEIFEQILNYIYSSKIVRVRSDMLEELISAGQMLGVKFIANLGVPLSQVKGLPGLSKETGNKSDASTESMPIITESFSISAEEFNQTRKKADDDDSDGDVMFVSKTDAQTRAANKKSAPPTEIIDLDADDHDHSTAKNQESKDAAPKHQKLKDVAAKHQESKDVAAKHQESKDVAAKHQESKDAAAKHQESKDVAAKHQESKDVAAKHQESKDVAAKHQESKDATAKGQESKDATAKDQESKDAAAKDQESKDAASKIQESKDAVTKEHKGSTAPMKTESVKISDHSSALSIPNTSSNVPSSPARVSTESAPTKPARSSIQVTPEAPVTLQPNENSDTIGVQKKQISIAAQKNDLKMRLSDVSSGGKMDESNLDLLKSIMASKKTITLDKASEIDSISTGCKVYANIGENTYDIVPLKEDPGEGGSKPGKGKRSSLPTSPTGSPNSGKKRAKTEPEDHYELIMDGKTFFVCIICKRPYVCLTSLRRHFNTHSWEKKYPCHYCDKVFALAEYRTKHEIHHTQEKRYQCLLCNETFLNYQVLSTHCKQAHNQDPSGRKEKDDSGNNLYRLLPCRTLQMKPYSWSNEELGIPVIGEDGTVQHINPVEQEIHPHAPSKTLTWTDMFGGPAAHAQPVAHSRSGPIINPPPPPTPQGSTEFDFVIPETY